MGEDHVGPAAGDDLADGVAEVLPQAMQDEAVAVGEEPGDEVGGSRTCCELGRGCGR